MAHSQKLTLSLTISILGGFAGLAFSSQIDEVYSSSALVEIGMLGLEIESFSSTLARVNNPRFREKVQEVIRAKDQKSKMLDLTAIAVPNTKYIQIRALANDPETAKSFVALSVEVLQSAHELKIKPIKDKIESRFKKIEQVLGNHYSNPSHLEKSTSLNPKDGLLRAVWFDQILSSTEKFEVQREFYESELTYFTYRPTSVVGEIYASETPVSPKIYQIGIVAFILTFVVSYLFQSFDISKLSRN
ncbi:MAG: hypothetical protein EOP04_30940 [Proteobacteria bacterium]|nr:MAG: hypothetical protein EOP04_30940 [Pseudomonadota bacterium]